MPDRPNRDPAHQGTRPDSEPRPGPAPVGPAVRPKPQTPAREAPAPQKAPVGPAVEPGERSVPHQPTARPTPR